MEGRKEDFQLTARARTYQILNLFTLDNYSNFKFRNHWTTYIQGFLRTGSTDNTTVVVVGLVIAILALPQRIPAICSEGCWEMCCYYSVSWVHFDVYTLDKSTRRNLPFLVVSAIGPFCYCFFSKLYWNHENQEVSVKAGKVQKSRI